MKITDLRRIIKEEIAKALTEAGVTTSHIPQSFDEFRKWMATGLHTAGAPADLADEVGDVDYQGGGVVSQLFSTWQSLEAEIAELPPEDLKPQWDQMLEWYVLDLVVGLVSEYENKMNYEPGARKGQKPLDAHALGEKVLHALTKK